MSREFWLEGPVEGIPSHLMPVAHALLQWQLNLREAFHAHTGTTPAPAQRRRLDRIHLRHLVGSH